MKVIYDMDEGNKLCNCYETNKLADGRCFHDNNCRKSMVVYNLHCQICDKDYVGKTQNSELRTTSKSTPVNTFTMYGR
jgi:hypothetical protein